MTGSRFRIILGVYLLVSMAGFALAFFPAGYSAELEAAYQAEPLWLADAPLTALVPVALVALVAVIAGFVGLYLFKPWGRALTLFMTVTGVALAAVSGPLLASGWETAMFDVSNLLLGAILALAYFSPVAARFESRGSGANRAGAPEAAPRAG